MILDIRRIFKADGLEEKLDRKLDFSDFEFDQNKPFKNPVTVNGFISNNAGLVNIKMNVSTKTNFVCDRCLEEFEEDYSEDFEHTLVQDSDVQKDDYILAENAKLDLDELVLSDILLSLPYKILCDEDCKGLCPHCWQNLNISECDCNTSID